MQPVSPVLSPEFESRQITYAEHQKEYIPLPVHRNSQGVVLSRWTLTDTEREAIAHGADIFLINCTFNQPIQPVRLEVGVCDRDLMAWAEEMELTE